MRVDVYRNLNRKGVVYSIRHRGKVIDWRSTVLIGNVKAKHPNLKQLQAVRSSSRQVCAWVSGELLETLPTRDGWKKLRFDPRENDRFPFDRCDYVYFTPKGVYWK